MQCQLGSGNKCCGKQISTAKRRDWEDMVETAEDIVCLVRHFMHSDHLSQEPLLVLPESVAADITDTAPTLVLARSPFLGSGSPRVQENSGGGEYAAMGTAARGHLPA